jgi:nitrogen fixation/metabolism regulation signal transduction histidine kinase
MIIAFVFAMFLFTVAIIRLSVILIQAIVNPINELIQVLTLVTKDDLSGNVPSQASSKDMKILLDAFVNLMVALRFGSDSYARGDVNRAKATFSDALQLYTATGVYVIIYV